MDETVIKSRDKTEIKDETEILSSSDETKMVDSGETSHMPSDEIYDNQSTFISGISENEELQETLISPDNLDQLKENSDGSDKTSSLFSTMDIQQKLDNEIANIPEDYEEYIEPEQMSHIIKDHFPSHTEAEKIRVNRNFLKDAEPFRLELLAENLKNSRDGLPTGFKSLDQFITIPANSITLIVSRPKHGKTCFMLNMLLNMCRLFPGKRFLFYSYEEPKWDVFLKLINMSGTKQFTLRENRQSNLEHWEWEFNHLDIHELKKKAGDDLEYSGLKNFLDISGNVHVIDSNHNCTGLMDSIQAFGKTFEIGAIFIDSLAKIPWEDETKLTDRRQQLQEIANNLRKFAAEIRIPLILSASLTTGLRRDEAPEYDDLVEENLVDCGFPGQNANVIIGLQNYARSRFIGSNINKNFKSNFLDVPLKKPEPMPDFLKDMVHKTIFLAKVIANKTGPEPETELIFHKQLLKISDFQAEL